MVKAGNDGRRGDRVLGRPSHGTGRL
jgi:hypothetical protein